MAKAAHDADPPAQRLPAPTIPEGFSAMKGSIAAAPAPPAPPKRQKKIAPLKPYSKAAKAKKKKDSARNRPPLTEAGLPRISTTGPKSGYTDAKAMQICSAVSGGSTFAAACEAIGLLPRQGIRWRIQFPAFRAMFDQARLERIDVWSEQMVEISDQRDGDYEISSSGRTVTVKEQVLRSKLKIETRQWIAARLMPQQWGDRQTIDMKHDWSNLSEEERVRKALALLGMVREVVERKSELRPIVYDATDGDVLAEQERQQKLIEQQPEMAEAEPGGIGR